MIELDVINDSEDLSGDGASGPHFWRSPAQMEAPAGTSTEDEFQDGTSQPPSGASRRQFLQLMGAAMAMGGLTACRRPVEKILPYARNPEEVIPGVPHEYATAMPFRGLVRPLLVKSNDGRPTKAEGNSEHPYSGGGVSPYEPASVLNLYDPDRSSRVRQDGSAASWGDFMRFCQSLGDDAEGQSVAVMAPPTSSPTMQAMRERLESRFADVQWISYAAEGDDPVAQGMQQAFGTALRPAYDFGAADVIVSLDADFLDGTAPNFLHNTATFAEHRTVSDPSDDMSRLYAVESSYTTTGGIADNRLRMQARRISHLATALASALGVDVAPTGTLSQQEQTYVDAIAEDLQNAGPQSVVLAGETQPPAVHALAMAINEQLGSLGEVVTFFDTENEAPSLQSEALSDLVEAMSSRSVDMLLMLDVNPVYSAPAELGFEEAMRQVPTTVHVSQHVDETARAANWHVPEAHYLEAWGDGRTYDGTLSIIQPLIDPLYEDAHSLPEVVNALATGTDTAGYDLVREVWRGQIDQNFEDTWRRTLHDGYLADSQYATTTPESVSLPESIDTYSEDGYEVVTRLDPTLLDGRFSNNAWMQELPDPITKIVWDNVALMSPATAEELGVEVTYDAGVFRADEVEIAANGTSVTLPAWIQPGFPDGSIGLTMGYGRALVTRRSRRQTPFWNTDDYTDIYGDGPLAGGIEDDGTPYEPVGTNVAPLRSNNGRITTGASVTRVGSGYKIVSTQEHGSMEGRPLARWSTLDEFREEPGEIKEMGQPVPGPEDSYEDYPELWEDNHPSEQPAMKDSPYYDNQWGMVIDLNTCMGCNACVVACTSENNVQVVGKEEVGNGRHMYWMRMDRYYVSEDPDDESPDMVTQPVTCHHCENAPCESVCPVAATVHSPDGTNQMVYNRCIGTRYCSNNCPYKVRRFNYYNWVGTLPDQVQMAQNPNVTVRSRGVMEKCTFCIHRVRGSQRQARNEDRPLQTDEVQTACQQACPTNAITFGDLNDPESELVAKRENPRRYEMLDYLNTKPRLSYLGRVRNPNPRLESAEASADAA
ncbi:hydrogenase [Longimonas halophila]|uniref:Hydrogenase n=1 Tax=Longimonas halophila TaxID=1469170 RepID=A0A2H3NRE9_9BACT|nr:4Fe-4S dicluster domain-containing protein [Longimonas halophila]PEN06031.1 hydrogenase [Longimonas halophila]